MKIVKVVIGGIFGLLVGAVLGLVAAAWWSTLESPPPPPGQAVGWDPISLLHAPMLQAIVGFCALAFGYLFGYLFSRIGARKPHAQM
jgi:ribose/xylose/arabinose/galactoside ABC-type transport system permease subunit